jgi:hypothetical protein
MALITQDYVENCAEMLEMPLCLAHHLSLRGEMMGLHVPTLDLFMNRYKNLSKMDIPSRTLESS